MLLTRLGYSPAVERFVIDDDQLLVFDGETIEFFWRGVSPGTCKWRFHFVHVGADMSLNRKGNEVAVTVGDQYGSGYSGVQFNIPVARSDELLAFFTQAGIRPT